MKGFLYQTISAGKRPRQRRDRKRESVQEVACGQKWEIASAIKLTIRGNIYNRCGSNLI